MVERRPLGEVSHVELLDMVQAHIPDARERLQRDPDYWRTPEFIEAAVKVREALVNGG